MTTRRKWKLEDAKNRFSEVVRAAIDRGPQRITKHGKDAVVIVAAEEYDRLVAPGDDIVTFMKKSPLARAFARRDIDLSRSTDLGREVEL